MYGCMCRYSQYSAWGREVLLYFIVQGGGVIVVDEVRVSVTTTTAVVAPVWPQQCLLHGLMLCLMSNNETYNMPP